MRIMRVAFVIIGVAIFSLFAINEVFWGFPTSLWSYGLVVGLFGASLFSLRPPTAHFRMACLLACISLAMILLHAIPWPTRDPFLVDFYSVRPGMRAADVRRIMAKHSEGTGWPANPLDEPVAGEFKVPGALVFRRAGTDPGNSEWGIVHFRRDKVTTLEYNPD
jgi:hypothetical protein